MEPRSAERKLDDLPESTDEYWEESDVNLRDIKEPRECNHFFRFEDATKIKCDKCGMGLFVGEGDVIVDGHLFHFDEEII